MTGLSLESTSLVAQRPSPPLPEPCTKQKTRNDLQNSAFFVSLFQPKTKRNGRVLDRLGSRKKLGPHQSPETLRTTWLTRCSTTTQNGMIPSAPRYLQRKWYTELKIHSAFGVTKQEKGVTHHDFQHLLWQTVTAQDPFQRNTTRQHRSEVTF